MVYYGSLFNRKSINLIYELPATANTGRFFLHLFFEALKWTLSYGLVQGLDLFLILE